MLELLPGPAHVVAMRVGGHIEEADIDRAIEAIERALKDEPRISFYAEVTKLQGMTASALAKDLRYGLGMLRQVDRLARAAVVTDEEWIRALTRFEAWLVPRLEIRIFGSAEREEAFAWASQTPPAQPPELQDRPAIRMLDTTDPKVVAFEVEGYLTGEDIARLTGPFLQAFERQEKLRVLGRFKRLPGIDLSTLMQDKTFALKLKALQRVERYAVVGGPSWLKNMVELLNPLFTLEVRYFDAEEEQQAWEWLGASLREA